jgi:asparagine synthase (glutamine-hydrolysing)
MYKLDKENKKIILREIAEDFGLDKEFAQRKKKAAQYGSNFVKGIDKLAKKHGFTTKKEYLQSLL